MVEMRPREVGTVETSEQEPSVASDLEIKGSRSLEVSCAYQHHPFQCALL